MTLQKATFSLTMILLATAIPVCLASGNVVAAETDTSKPDKQQNEYPLLEEIERNPLKPPDTSSPRATLKSFLDNANEAYRLVSSAHRDNKNTPGLFTSKTIRKQGQMADQLMQRAIYCLNLSKIPWALKRSTGYEGALFLKELLDRIELPPWEAIPGPEPHETGAQTQKTESLVRWRLPGTQIVIAKVEEGPRQGEFLFASEIIPLLNTYMNKVIHLPYRTDANTSPGFLKLYDRRIGSGMLPAKWSHWLPPWSHATFFYNTILQWCLMVVVLISLLLLFLTLYRWWNKRAVGASPVKRTWGRALIIIGAAIGTVLALAFCSKYVGISGPLLMGLNFSMEVVAMILFARAALLLGSALGKTIVASPKIDPRGINAGLINASCAFISFIAAGFIVIYGLSNLGVSLIPLLTGLGVGGLAVALAARPTLENLIGGFMILLDKPYRIGQRVMVKGYDGNVEKVGWRSTQVRLRSGPQVTIPNEEMARLDIENIDRRPFIRRKTNITITYGTPPEKIEKAVQIIQGILDNHEGMDPDWPPWVFFDEFNADSLNIVVYYWYHPPDLHKFLSFSQQINLQIFRAFEKEEIAFAFPTTTSYLTQEDGQRLKVDIANPI